MSEHADDTQQDTGSLDTGAFRAFASREDETSRKALGVPFRLLTLGGGLTVLALVVWFLMRL
jgi:hypothetical protein